MAIRRLKNVGDVIEAIGRSRLIEITGVDTQHVTNWRSYGTFPANTHHVITEELRGKGYSAPPELFSQRVFRRGNAA